MNQSLEDIIASQRPTKGGRSFGRGGRGFGNASGGINGQWSRDLFQEANGRGGRRRSGATLQTVVVGGSTAAATIQGIPSSGGGGNPNKIVRVNLANLAPSVSSSDLEELFEPYACKSVTVHFTESGTSLCTGDAFFTRSNAELMLNALRGISIDGKRLEMVIVDGNRVLGTAGGLADRVVFPNPLNAQALVAPGVAPFVYTTAASITNFNNKRGGGGGGGGGGPIRSGRVHKEQRSTTHYNTKFLDRLADESPKAGGARGGNKKAAAAATTSADLDAELEAYMKKSKAV